MPKIGDGEVNEKVFIGIDPGVSGGMAALCRNGVRTSKMLASGHDVWQWVCEFGDNVIFADPTPAFAIFEQNTGFVGGQGNTGSSMFKFGENSGMMKAFLIAAGIPFEVVAPGTWQKALGIPGRRKDESKTDWKNRLKSNAQRLFPGVEVTLHTADALLIAEYCRRKMTGVL